MRPTPLVNLARTTSLRNAASSSSSASQQAEYRLPSPFTDAHRSYVKSLYKRILKNEQDWLVRRDLWRNRAIEVRAEFERNRDVRNPRQLAVLLDAAEKQLKTYQHPDPYRTPMGEDGTKWERNIPPTIFSEAEKKAFKESIEGYI